jgi:6,7-dimethyl-8-ribityllumazine synthase
MAGFGDPHLSTVDAAGLRLGIVGSRWHSDLVDHMVDRAQQAAKACGVDDVLVARVAGSVELPVVAQALAKRCDAVVALGVVIRGETAHFTYVCEAVTSGLTRVALDEQTPVAHGVLTVDSLGQAKDRAGLEDSIEDKGWQATVAVLDAALAIRALPDRPRA